MAVLAFVTSIGGLMATAPAALRRQSGTDGLGSQQQDYALSCRGGGQLVFVPIKPPTDGDQAVTFEVPFATGTRASGQEGQDLQRGTCEWVDRPVNGEEPRRVRVKVHMADSMPRRTAGDPPDLRCPSTCAPDS